MGKFQSKLASKRRQSPEGGSLASNVLNCQRESELIHIHKTKLTKNLYVELRENKSDRNLKVILPQDKKTPDGGGRLHFQVDKQTKKRSGHAGVTECNMVLDKDTRQEWLFTLYNFDNSGKVTREDMCSLIHSMYEVLGASVKQPQGGTTPLKIKLVVTPSADPEKTSHKAAAKDQNASQEAGTPVRSSYCVDENIERRNHYLDLAGIENYTSKFDTPESPCHESGQQDAHAALQHRPLLIRENCTSPDFPRGLHSPLCQRNKATTGTGKDRSGVEGKACRLHRHHSAPWCHPAQRTQSRRLRSRAQDNAPHPRSAPGAEREPQTSAAKRHDHHHHHEHHHHHHHHYHPS